ncbi:MAG: glycoside hydrolase, partial [Acidobacteriaceae bacterium]|nr:glycoside hydrolase [Acidobacteriaceae bacterium]
IYAIAPSPLDINTIWAGTDDGLVHVTTDGGATWKNVTPSALIPWAKVSIIDAGHFRRGAAYVAVNTFRLDDLRPHIYRTGDGGRTWKEIVEGIPDGAAINVVREDPRREGLLFAGSERAVYVSFDNGDHWQSLRVNMPATSIRDLLIKDDDLIAATHGRGFWILDDIEPLRELSGSVVNTQAHLFQPQTAIRVRWNTNTDTPLPPDVPAGKNPPDGAVIDYLIGNGADSNVKLEIFDSLNHLIRRYSSSDPAPPVDPHLAIPRYWLRPPEHLSNEPGLHRFLWDMHYTPLPVKHVDYPMQAVFEDTPPQADSPWVMPGAYIVRLTAGGQSYTRSLTVKMDPRVRTSTKGLSQQFTLSKQIYDDLLASTNALEEIRAFRAQLRQHMQSAGGATAGSMADLDGKALALQGEAEGRGARRGAAGPDTISSINGTLTSLLQGLQEADVAPTSQAIAAVADRRAALAKLLQSWAALKAQSQ